MVSKLLATDLAPGVTQKDIELYKQAHEEATKATPLLPLAVPEQVNPAAIEFGKFEVKTWYSSPFPQEYARSVSSNPGRELFFFFDKFLTTLW